MHETKIRDELIHIWNTSIECRKSRSMPFLILPKSVAGENALETRLKNLFISIPDNHNKSLHISIQSLFLAIWADINIKYALNYLLMDEYCTDINIFAVSMVIRLLAARCLYDCRCINSKWVILLQNEWLLQMMTEVLLKVESILIFSLTHYHSDLVRLVNETMNDDKTFVVWTTIQRGLRKVLRDDEHKTLEWAFCGIIEQICRL